MRESSTPISSSVTFGRLATNAAATSDALCRDRTPRLGLRLGAMVSSSRSARPLSDQKPDSADKPVGAEPGVTRGRWPKVAHDRHPKVQFL